MSELSVKKKMLISFLAIFVVFVILAGSTLFLSENIDNIIYDEIPRGNAIFPYEPDYMENIFADKEYMDLDRTICYTDVKRGLTVSIDDDNYTSYPEIVIFMYEYIRSMIYGDTLFYNDCYSDRFIAVEGKKAPFTMQKLYDVEFGVETTDQVTNDGIISKVWLDYKIFKNNITLRNDIGSNVSRRQHLTLIREGTEDELKIISVSYEKVPPRKVLNIVKTIFLIIGMLALYIGTIAGLITLFKKMKVKKSTEANDDNNQNDNSKNLKDNETLTSQTTNKNIETNCLNEENDSLKENLEENKT